MTPLEQSYADCEDTIKRSVYAYWRKYHGDLEEYMSLASEVFCKAYESFDYGKHPSFNRYLHWMIWNALLSRYNKEKRRKQVPLFTDNLSRRTKEFHLEEFLDDLSADGATVVKLSLSLASPRAKVKKSLIKEVLKELGWTMQRILESFSEIAEALK